METDPNFTALRRAYPMETAGTLKEYHYDRERLALTVTYDAAPMGETVLFLPFAPGSFVSEQPFSHREQPLPVLCSEPGAWRDDAGSAQKQIKGRTL